MTILCGRGAVTAARFPNLHAMEASSCVFEIVIGCYLYHCFLNTRDRLFIFNPSFASK
jgi:hypothetical protein